MLYLLNKDVRTVRWNGEPLHEATSAIVKETMNGDFTLTVKYPISDSGIYQLIQEDMLIKAPTPVLGAQLFRIKKPIEHNDHLEITAYHISDDVMQRSITPVSVTSQSCGMALSRMVQNTKTALGDFSFNSDIQDRRTFNTTETETLYSVLLDGKHSIVGTWEGELVRDNFAMTVKKSRGENRGVVITTHKNLKDYQRTKNSHNVVTRIHAKSTFKPEGAEKETTIRVTVDSPLINSYPYINEKEYENNNAKTVEELQKWAQAKFTNQGIDKVSDAIKIEAYELDGQVVHMGDTVNLKSWKHNVDSFKKAIAYEFDALKEEYLSLTFDDKAGTGGSRASGGLSSAADAILGVTGAAQEIALEKALQNADLDFDHKAGLLRQEILDGIELARAKTEEVKRELSDTINQHFDSFENGPLQDAKRRAIEALRNAGASSLLAQEAKQIGLESVAKLDALKQTAEALQSDLLGINTYINEDVRRQEALYRYVYEEGERQATAVREQINQDFVNKSTYQEDARGIERRFEAITNPQNGLIATQIANYKTAVDGRFADITSLIAGKANQIDFQRVKETSQLYERIIGNNDNSISNNIARMALTNQLFQVEVAKASASGRNLFLSSTATKGYLGRAGVINVANSTQKEITSDFISVEPNEKIIFQHWVTLPENGMAFSAWQFFDKNKEAIDARVTGSNAYKTATGKQHNINQIIVPANAYFIRVSARMYNDGLIKIERGSAPSNYSAAPEDTDEAIRTVQTQLAGSWAVQNLTSAGALVSGLNLGANGHNRLSGKLTHITGETLIDNAVIKSAMVDKLKTANFEAGSVTTVILDAEAVTAEKLKVDQAFFNKLVANEAYLNQLFAKQAFINRVQSISINASQVKAGFLSGDRILGGTITGSNIFGGTLTGHTQIQLGTYGSFDVVNGGIQINVPREPDVKDGLGVQFIGSYGRGENVPYGLFIYKDTDFTKGGTAETSDDFLLTVEGYIQTKGIGWLKTGKGSVNGKTTGTIGLWNSSNVSLAFGGPDNDIYYSYNGTAYSLWALVDKHFSDKRLKENIVDCEHNALDYIQQFQFKEYDWKKQDDRPRQAHTKIGLIAQEVQAVDPTLVYENGDTLSLDNLRLTTIALKAIQELSQRIETLERKLA